MRITQHGEHLFQLTRLAAFNAFLVREDDGFTLIDTNLPGSANGILKAAQELGQPIKRIVLTHAHSDHVASVDALKSQLPGAEIIMSARTARFLAGDMSLDIDEPQDKLRGGYVIIETKPTDTVKEGDRIGSLQVVAAPGHTPGQIALLDTRDQSLIAGDAFQTAAGIAVTGVLRVLFPFPAFATWHKPTALQTARKLRALNPSRLAVGHGSVIENPAVLMDKAIAEAQHNFDIPLNMAVV